MAGTTKRIISDRALRATYQFTDEQIGRVHWLVEKQSEILGSSERNHSHYVKRAAEAVRDGRSEFLDHTLGDFKQAANEIAVGSRPAYFHAMFEEATQRDRAENVTPSHLTAPPAVNLGAQSLTGEPFGQLFARAQDNQPEDSRDRMIADAERRGFSVPAYIRSAEAWEGVRARMGNPGGGQTLVEEIRFNDFVDRSGASRFRFPAVVAAGDGG